MRPVYLSIAGLHSFREQQEIDFLSLCEAGVFGIFGPTGSGKSSILDALTLALYGKVERAHNNTQGIMNHAEDEIQISFTFELGNAGGTKRYRIERTFKRTGDFTLKTSLCRLLHLTEETTVLADKNNEVQQKIHDLLGLTIDDFTRAVVLPQGKFAEFLSLKGTERRQMLQRLFHLEPYGDELNKKLRQRLSQTESQLHGIVREQQGLGDSSKEALEQTEKRVRECEQMVQQIERERKKLEQSFEQNQKVWHWQLDLEQVKAEISRLYEHINQIVSLEAKLKQAIEAQQLKPYVDEWEESASCVQMWEEKNSVTTKALNEWKMEEGKHVEAYQLAVKEKEEQQPYWIERQSQLKQAQELEHEILQQTKEIEELKALHQKESDKEKNSQELLEKSKSLYSKALLRQKELKTELVAKTVSLEDRERVRKATQEQLIIFNREESFRQLQQEGEEKQSERQALDIVAQKAAESYQVLKHRAESFMAEIHDNHQQLHCVKEILTQQLTWGNRLLEASQKRLEHLKESELAHNLAQHLQQGEACPVCGSPDHPHPAKDVSGFKQALEVDRGADEVEKLAKLKKLLETGKEQHFQLQANFKSVEHMYEDVKDALADQGNISNWKLVGTALNGSEEVAATAGQEVEVAPNLDREAVSSCVYQLETCILQAQASVPSIAKLENQSKPLIKEIRLQSREEKDLSIKLDALLQDIQKREEKLVSNQKEVTQLIEKWKENYPQYEWKRMEQVQEQLHQVDSEAERIKQGLEKSILYIEEKEREIEQLQQEMNAVHILQAERKAINIQKNEALEQKKAQLQQYIGQQQVEQLLREARQKLEELKKHEQVAAEKWKYSREKLQSLEKEQSIAIESLKQAEQRMSKATEQWKNMMADSTFSLMETVKEALVSKEQQALWQQEIEVYRNEEKKWKLEAERLQELLKEQRVTAVEWEACLALHAELKLKWDEVIQERGAAKQAFTEIRQKHERYQELEQERGAASALSEKLGKLQVVFRGNSFVEYLAEEQLMLVCRDASERVGALTRQRYALEVDSSGGFVIRDDANGGVKRPVTTLSGGETFLTSLALALALSAQIQLKGEYPLEFFFLDEGFGTLDQDLLDTVITALENLHTNQLSVGVISHVPELRARLPRKLIVDPAEPSGRGSKVYVETL